MRKIVFYILVFINAISHNNYAQYLHTPDDLKKIMEKSDQSYKLDTLSGPVPIPSFGKILGPGWYISNGPEGITLEKPYIQTSKIQKKYHKKGKKHFLKGNYKKSIDLYKKSLLKSPENSSIMGLIAKTYKTAGNTETAAFWYEKAIEANPVDGNMYFELGETYMKQNVTDSALQYLITAHLLNRNDTTVLNKLKNLYKNEGLIFLDFNFSVQYEISKKDETVYVQANDEPWQSYAICKAIWAHETSYKENMDRDWKADISFVEQKECLLNALISYTRMKADKAGFPELYCLGKALSVGLVDEYLLYEIQARTNPELLLISKGDKVRFDRLMRYVRECKTVEKVH